MIHIDAGFATEAVQKAYNKRVTDIEPVIINETHEVIGGNAVVELGANTVFIGSAVFYNFLFDQATDSDGRDLIPLMNSTGNMFTIKERLTFTPQGGTALVTVNMFGFKCMME